MWKGDFDVDIICTLKYYVNIFNVLTILFGFLSLPTGIIILFYFIFLYTWVFLQTFSLINIQNVLEIAWTLEGIFYQQIFKICFINEILLKYYIYGYLQKPVELFSLFIRSWLLNFSCIWRLKLLHVISLNYFMVYPLLKCIYIMYM